MKFKCPALPKRSDDQKAQMLRKGGQFLTDRTREDEMARRDCSKTARRA